LEELKNWDPFAPHPRNVKSVASIVNDKHKFLSALGTACHLCQNCELGIKEAERTVQCRSKDGSTTYGEVVIARDPHVFSNMAYSSRFIVVGQNPGWEELEKGEPFVGAAGRNFNNALKRNNMSRNDFYISNAVKCFSPNNTKPTIRQQKKCSTWLQMEINAIKPILVITLGASAFDVLCPDLKYSSSLGTIVKSIEFGIKVFPIYHPSPLNVENLPEFNHQIDRLCELITRYKESKSL